MLLSCAAAALYTSSYAHKAQRLQTSCVKWGVCCSTSLVPDGAIEGEPEGSYRLRHRLIAMKPVSAQRDSEGARAWRQWVAAMHDA